jgi:hypothetical protein
MFSDLFWAVYLIDVLSDFPALILVPAVLFAFVTMIVALHNDSQRYESNPISWSYKKFWTPTLLVAFAVALLIILVPSKGTMYMMLGVKTTQNVVESPLGKKLTEIINAEVDGYLKGLTEKQK